MSGGEVDAELETISQSFINIGAEPVAEVEAAAAREPMDLTSDDDSDTAQVARH